MFFKKLKNKLFLLIISLVIIPTQVFAYSDYIIAGGENIGIQLNSSGVIIVGTYEIGNKNPAKDANLQNGDKIIKVNGKDVKNIQNMLEIISKSDNQEEVELTYLRGSKEYSTILNLEKVDDVYKTGLYVKDSVNGVGTLTFIDPETGLYGALGHEVLEKTTNQKLEIKDGIIYSSTVTGITKSDNGSPGEKNATYDTSKVFGSVYENTESGIFGKYTGDTSNRKLYKVAEKDELKLGEAKILTVISGNEIEEFSIEIIKTNNNKNTTKNLLFKITDEKLLNATGGIVQGMSGSPIIQDDKIVGAVTHVVVDEPTKGYGIFITNMLEEAEN